MNSGYGKTSLRGGGLWVKTPTPPPKKNVLLNNEKALFKWWALRKTNFFYFSILPGDDLTITRLVIFNNNANEKLIKNLEVPISENAAYILQRPMLQGVTSCLHIFYFRLPIRPFRIIGAVGGGGAWRCRPIQYLILETLYLTIHGGTITMFLHDEKKNDELCKNEKLNTLKTQPWDQKTLFPKLQRSDAKEMIKIG